MNIKERIEKIKEYFVSMEIKTVDESEQIIYVLVEFPQGWMVDYEIENKFDIQILKVDSNNSNSYYFVGDINNGVDVVFDAIEHNIVKMKDAIERAQLLTKKTKELKELFSNENIPLSSLRDLTFSYQKEVTEEQEQISETETIKNIISGGNKKKEEKNNTEDKSEE